MLFRHSHVFGSAVADTTGEALANWESRKLEEKGFSSLRQDLEDIPAVLPALMRAQKVAKKIRKAEGVSENPVGELATEQKIGEMLYQICKQADLSGVDAELALNRYLEGVIENENR